MPDLIDLRLAPASRHQEAAEILLAAMSGPYPRAWPTVESARAEFDSLLFLPDAIAIGAVDGEDSERLLGWVGGLPQYRRRVWEIHPLAVRPEAQRRGVGSALLAKLEQVAASRGGETLWAGTDDETGLTSLAGLDLYPDPLRHLAAVEDRGGHPISFYRKMGFAVAGVLPDANGPGKPDIFLAKRIARAAESGKNG